MFNRVCSTIYVYLRYMNTQSHHSNIQITGLQVVSPKNQQGNHVAGSSKNHEAQHELPVTPPDIPPTNVPIRAVNICARTALTYAFWSSSRQLLSMNMIFCSCSNFLFIAFSLMILSFSSSMATLRSSMVAFRSSMVAFRSSIALTSIHLDSFSCFFSFLL